MNNRTWGIAGGFLGAVLAARAFAAQATVTVTAPPASVGKPAAIDIRFRVAEGSHIDPEAPLSIRLTGPASVRFDKAELHYADAVPPPGPAPRFVVHATAGEAGEQEIRVAMRWYVCAASLCTPRHETETVRLRVR